MDRYWFSIISGNRPKNWRWVLFRTLRDTIPLHFFLFGSERPAASISPIIIRYAYIGHLTIVKPLLYIFRDITQLYFAYSTQLNCQSDC